MQVRSRLGVLSIAAGLLLLSIVAPASSDAREPRPASAPAPADAWVEDSEQLLLSDDFGQSEFLDAHSGRRTTVSDVVIGDRAVLIWYWRPNCDTSRTDVDAVAQFAREHRDTVQVIGIGALGDMDDVREFVAAGAKSSVPLLWEPSGHGWLLNGVRAPSVMQLFSPDLVERSQPMYFDEHGRATALDAAPQPKYATASAQ